ncbi:hypothetical protein DL96DRAFT_1497904 [Flagelloscypha sp. PMI_526]|nr:hypothetical protein DL96DRAFT_1497904 [Flagelloscypha sp. PMI_526]
MPSSPVAQFTPPALLLGLGARVLSDRVSGAESGSMSSLILVGLWQGVGLLYAVQSSDFYLLVIVGIALRLLFDFTSDQDLTKILITIATTGLGFFVTDFLTQVLDDSPSSTTPPKLSESKRKSSRSHSTDGSLAKPRKRVRRRSEAEREDAYRAGAISDITSVDTHSELVPVSSSTPLERDVATLRARAALADSERRRYREEKKWALSQGNTARAEQMAWQVKRYTALMKSFLREADAKLTDSSNGVLTDHNPTSPVAGSSSHSPVDIPISDGHHREHRHRSSKSRRHRHEDSGHVKR